MFRGKFLQKVFRQQLDVAIPLAQWRHRNKHNSNAVIKVFPELPGSHGLLKEPDARL